MYKQPPLCRCAV